MYLPLWFWFKNIVKCSLLSLSEAFFLCCYISYVEFQHLFSNLCISWSFKQSNPQLTSKEIKLLFKDGLKMSFRLFWISIATMRFFLALSIGLYVKGLLFVLPFFFFFLLLNVNIFSKVQHEPFPLFHLDFNALRMVSRQIHHSFAREVFCVLGLLNVTLHLFQ